MAPEWKVFGWILIAIGLIAVLVSVPYWFLANYRPRLPWISRAHDKPTPGVEDSETERIGAGPTGIASPPSLEKSLYVADIRFTFGDLSKNRQSELTMRVFNGSGRDVNFGRVSGQISFSAPNTQDEAQKGWLPEPTWAPTAAVSALLLEEVLLVLRQPVPSEEANKILKMLKSKTPIHFDLSRLAIEVIPNGDNSKMETLPIWAGVSYKSDYGFGRIISAVGKAPLREA